MRRLLLALLLVPPVASADVSAPGTDKAEAEVEAAAPAPSEPSTERSPDGRYRAYVRDNHTYLVGPAADHRRRLAGYPKGPGEHGGAVERALFSPDSRWLAVGGRCKGNSGVTVAVKPRCLDGLLQVWDVATALPSLRLAATWNETDDRHEVLAIAFSPDGQRVAALTQRAWSDCSAYGEVYEITEWRLDTGRRTRTRVLDEWQQRATPSEPARYLLTYDHRNRLRARRGTLSSL